GSMGDTTGATNEGGDAQKQLDVIADRMILDALRDAPVAAYLSEETGAPVALCPDASCLVACDPLDGSSNIDCNAPIGTICSIMPAVGDMESGFLQPGHTQLAALFILYGPQLSMVVSVGQGTALFVYSPDQGCFVCVEERLQIPASYPEFAVNVAYMGHWHSGMRAWFDRCIAGREGAWGQDYRMRWVGSLVADAYRIFMRGGIFLYPCDMRASYREGRLRLLYEACPIAMLVEQAGGQAYADDGPVLLRQPEALHQRTGLVFGSADEVERWRSCEDLV
ncbi:MAG: class 1 fructose-bisphosphatase, partial [Pseudomonadota bacterium]